MDNHQSTIPVLLGQLQTLRKCGFTLVPSPNLFQSQAKQRHWLIVAAALLHGHCIKDLFVHLDTPWQRLFRAVEAAGTLDVPLHSATGFSADAIRMLNPVLTTACQLEEALHGHGMKVTEER